MTLQWANGSLFLLLGGISLLKGGEKRKVWLLIGEYKGGLANMERKKEGSRE